MNNSQYPYGYPMVSPTQPIQQMFPQPQGSVYSINSPAEIGNVPIGSTGLSVAICLSENLMYIKSFQGGNPIIMAYRVAPFSKEDGEAAKPLTQLEERISLIEQALTKLTQKTNGGILNDLL